MPSRYAVFGHPIAHSLSPRIHAAFGEQLGIALDYRAIDAEPGQFAARVGAFASEGGRGANVTLPFKQEAVDLCATISERARRSGSVNTLVRVEAGWHGDSTDGSGLLADLELRQGFSPANRRCLILGAGGAARAVAFALAEAQATELVIANRTRERADRLAAGIGDDRRVRACSWDALHSGAPFDLIVHATAAGHGGDLGELPPDLAHAETLAYDLSYGNAANPFLERMRSNGVARRSDGLGMLVEQAADAFAIWHDRRPDTAPVYAALRARLDGPAAR